MEIQSLGRGDPTVAPNCDLTAELERVGLVRVPCRSFSLRSDELGLLDIKAASGGLKSISYDPSSGRLEGWPGAAAQAALATSMLGRFSAWATAIVRDLAPRYAPRLEVARASFRPRSFERKPLGWRADDRRLHVDAFPSRPSGGRRILRLFVNIDPERPRVWDVGEDFQRYAERFLPSARLSPPGLPLLLAALGFTKPRRTAYDQLMLELHDLAKRDDAYQRSGRVRREAFAPGEVWVAFTDQLPHALAEGRLALEQTFHLPVSAQLEESSSPLRILESVTGRRLA